MSQQSVRQAARRSALNAQAVLRKQRADRERRLEALAVEVVTALGERDGAVRDAELHAGSALLAMTDDEGFSVREAVEWCRQRRHIAGSDSAAPPCGPAFGQWYRVSAPRVSAAGLAALSGDRSDGASRWRRVSRVAGSSLSSSTSRYGALASRHSARRCWLRRRIQVPMSSDTPALAKNGADCVNPASGRRA